MGAINSKRKASAASPKDFYAHDQAAVPSDGAAPHRSSMATTVTLWTADIPDDAYVCAHNGVTTCPACYDKRSMRLSKAKSIISNKSIYSDKERSPQAWARDECAAGTEDGASSVHYLFRAVTGRAHLAPLERPAVALCVGHGTHVWLTEMGTAYPAATWYALDPSSPEVTSAAMAAGLGLPANCRVHHPIKNAVRVNGLDAGSALSRYPTSHFDYVHQRLTLLTIPTSAWRSHLKELARVTRPGGFLELSEISLLPDGNAGPASRKLAHVLKQFLLNAYGVDPLKSQAELELLGEPEGQQPLGDSSGLRAAMVTQSLQVLQVRKYNVPVGYCPPSVLAETVPVRSLGKSAEERERHYGQVRKMGNVILGQYKRLYTQWAEEIVALGWLPESDKQQELWRTIREWEREMLTVGGWAEVLVVVARRKVQSSDTTRQWT